MADDRTVRRHTALITGGSRGIGFEIARLFARDRYDLVLVARDAEELVRAGRELVRDYGVQCVTIAADLSDAATPARLAVELRARGLEIDAFVASAGAGLAGPFADSDLAAELRLIQLNATSITHLTKLLLPGMLARGDGRILAVASTAGFVPGPFMAVYYATKAYVLSFTEALAEELGGTGIRVTALCPGPTRTAFEKGAGIGGTRLFHGAGVGSARAAARAGYDGLARGRTVVVPGLRNRLLVAGARLMPRAIVRRVVRRLNSPASGEGDRTGGGDDEVSDEP